MPAKGSISNASPETKNAPDHAAGTADVAESVEEHPTTQKDVQ